MSRLACVPCGSTYTTTTEYLEHIESCPRVLPSANRAAAFWLSELKRNGGEPKKKKRRVRAEQPAQQQPLL